MKWFDDVFGKSKAMLISGIISIVCFLFLGLYDAITGWVLSYTTWCFLIAINMTFLLLAYSKGETTLQKTLTGAIIMLITIQCIDNVAGAYDVSYSVEPIVESGISNFIRIDKVLSLAITILYLIIFVFYCILQTEHKGKKSLSKISEIILFVQLLLTIFIAAFESIYAFFVINLIHYIGYFCVTLVIVCIEVRIQKYKAIKYEHITNGNWDEGTRQKYKKIFKL